MGFVFSFFRERETERENVKETHALSFFTLKKKQK